MACKDAFLPSELNFHISMHMIHHAFNPIDCAAQESQIAQSLCLCWANQAQTVTPCAAASEQRQSARRPSTAANATVADAGQPPALAA